MQLKPEALNALKLPIKVKAGFLGSVKLKVGDVYIEGKCIKCAYGVTDKCAFSVFSSLIWFLPVFS